MILTKKKIRRRKKWDEAVFALVHDHISSFVGSQCRLKHKQDWLECVWWEKNSITECFSGYGNIPQFQLSSLCTAAKMTFVSTAEPGAACCHQVAFTNKPVFISLCVSWLWISVAVIHIVAGIGILKKINNN